MPSKIKLEWMEFHFRRKALMQALFSVLAAYAHLALFLRDWPGASVGEYMVYSLTDCNYFLVIFPVWCLVCISGRNNETCRYPLLLRYRSRNEFFAVRFQARILFLLIALAIHLGALFFAGHSLPVVPQMIYVSSENVTGIIIRQFLNIFCYVCVMFLLHEILSDVAGNAMLDVLLTAAVSLVNLLIVKLMLKSVIMWTPWGNIAYRLFGQERIPYRFYGFYWFFLIVLLFCLADELNGRKDYVFEENCKVG